RRRFRLARGFRKFLMGPPCPAPEGAAFHFHLHASARRYEERPGRRRLGAGEVRRPVSRREKLLVAAALSRSGGFVRGAACGLSTGGSSVSRSRAHAASDGVPGRTHGG